MPNPVPLSVVVITKNEKDRLRACLESAAWAGEIVIVDDESTDGTCAIAQEFTDRIIVRKMEIEGTHRNFAYAQAKYDWVFSLDADERITPQLAQELRTLLAGRPPFDVYAVPRRNYIGRNWIRHGGWYPSAQVKLFRKETFRWEETTVHPRAISDRPGGLLKNDLMHFSYRDFSDFVGKLNRQTTLEAKKWVMDGRRMKLGKALWRTLDRFYRSYVGKRGARDGTWGFIVAVMAGAYQFISFAKYWETKQTHPPEPGNPEHPIHLQREPAKRTHPHRIGVLLLAHNEAHRIQRCLASIEWVDEVVVMDDESQDSTAALCRDFGAQVIQRPFDNFSAQANAGLKHLTTEWVLSMDADEVVTPQLRSSIESVLEGDPQHVGYQFKRLNHFLGTPMRYGGWHHAVPHFFRREGTRFEGLLHHAPVLTGPMGLLKGNMHHFPFQRIDQFVERQNAYSSLQSLEFFQTRSHTPTPRWMLKYFWKMYIKKAGFRDGMRGFLFAVLYAWVDFLKWAKYWELQQNASQAPERTSKPVLESS